MGVTKTQQDLISAYLRKELKGKALNNFELELERNNSLYEEFVFQQNLAKAASIKAVKEAIALARINNLLENKSRIPKLEKVQNNINDARIKNIRSEKKQKIIRLLKIGTIAASIALIVFCNWPSTLYERVQGEVAIALDEEITKMTDQMSFAIGPSASTEYTSARKEVINYKLNLLVKAYKEKRIDEVFNLINSLKEDQFYRPDKLLYFEAGLHAEAKDYEKSVALLQALIQEKSDIEYDARWFSGLINLKINNNLKARSEFEVLIEKSEKYKKKASQKLKLTKHCL